ncbi:Uma2 family endonuclease [Aphanothece sacrum]|uniref:Putative restriction endonuclease domain-containing protein n=1 Tax=Aphanothece sacrum FPU1 TaxID=1920663 RepID=A0A401IKK1_APHSA|nr:Uma2 family endonuclease [Aphanothece sacrum]GBF81700.1 hypothetical protein AsFPU1_3119 [Aphanothece sacrum FPU1]GBF85058.1 hypothetical protein AsFPU3_2114 [Aphanothece sacrum FPU3]
MTQAISKLLIFDDYIAQYTKNGVKYELIEGKLIEMMRPIGKYQEIGGFLTFEIRLEIRRLQLPYFIPTSAVVKPKRDKTAYLPDVIVLDRNNILNDYYWEKASSISLGSSAKLVIEIVSYNWRDDYVYTIADYEALGISEYWIIDYLVLGEKRFIGDFKQPTITICQLVEDECQVKFFKENQPIFSTIFAELTLTVFQIFQIN